MAKMLHGSCLGYLSTWPSYMDKLPQMICSGCKKYGLMQEVTPRRTIKSLDCLGICNMALLLDKMGWKGKLLVSAMDADWGV